MDAAASLRFAIVCLDPQATDAVDWSLDTGAGLRARGHDVTVIAPARALWLHRVHAAGLRLDTRARRGWKPWTWLARRSTPFGSDLDTVIVSRAAFVHAAATRRSAAASVRLVRWQPGDTLQGTLPATRCVVLVGDASLRAAAATACGVAPEAVRVVRDGVRSTWDGAPRRDGRLDADALRYELRLPRAAPLLLHAASLRPESDHDTTFRALASVLERRRGLHANQQPNLVVLGTGPGEAQLRDLSHALHLNEHVIWVGQRPGLERYVAAADVVLHPGVEPALARDVVLALAVGTPAIVGAGAASAGVDASVLAIRPSQPEAWAGAIERGLDDAAWRRRVAAEASAWASAWSPADMLDDLECAVRARRWRERTSRPDTGRQDKAGALLVDRDDTLVHNVPYNARPEQVVLQDAAGRALRWLRDAGVPVIVVSNQSGVARGLLTEADVRAVNDRINTLLQAEGAQVEAFYFCPHHPDFGAPCACRKPEPGMLLQAAAEHGLDLSRSWMVGNSPSDLEAGTRAGAFVAGFGTLEHAGVLTYQRWPELVRDFLRWLEADRSGEGSAPQRATKNSRNSRGSASVVARG